MQTQTYPLSCSCSITLILFSRLSLQVLQCIVGTIGAKTPPFLNTRVSISLLNPAHFHSHFNTQKVTSKHKTSQISTNLFNFQRNICFYYETTRNFFADVPVFHNEDHPTQPRILRRRYHFTVLD